MPPIPPSVEPEVLALWDAIDGAIQTAPEISKIAYDAWLQELQPRTFDGTQLTLSIRTPFQRSVIEENYLSKLMTVIRRVRPEVERLHVIAEEEAPPDMPMVDDSTSFQRAALEYTFENFVVGPSNKFAHAASQAVAGKPGGYYNPLFIHGASGLGKTHLLSAICTEIREKHPQLKLLYIKTESMVNELVESIRGGTTAEFRMKYRFTDVLLVDDIQFLAGKEATQTEFFHTFDALHQAGKQIVVTSDRPPREISSLEERLRNRFEMGLLADVQPPDVETRIAIIKRKAHLLELAMPEDVCLYIADQLKNNIRQLEGTVRRIYAHQLLAGENPSIHVAQMAIRDLRSNAQPTPVTPERVIREVARTMSVTPEDIMSPRHNAPISRARQIAMYVVREALRLPLKDIGAAFGGRDHSTVVYALRMVEDKMAKDYTYKNMIQDLVKNIQSMEE